MKKIINVVAAVIKRKNEKEALKREINEELGCGIEVGQLISDVHHEYEEMIVQLKTYHAVIKKRTPTINEHAELRWVKQDELNTLEWTSADVPTVSKLM